MTETIKDSSNDVQALSSLQLGALSSLVLVPPPPGEDGLQWCKDKAVIIHGTNIKKPVYCTVDNSAPTDLRIFGHWTVDFNEPSCKTLWENFQDKGCVAIGSKTRICSSIPQIPEQSDFFGSVLKLIWVITNHHGIIGGRCAPLPPQTMMGIILISPVAVTTG
ncbi:hypothetical protein EDD85DRAFT_957850 [Armillaria nabsnona]|nr:hypothetical protein EDD85DRAFT_957850 [Armillaria nabsnona]